LNIDISTLRKQATRSWRKEYEGMGVVSPKSSTSELELPFLCYKGHFEHAKNLSEVLHKNDFRQKLLTNKIITCKLEYIFRYQNTFLKPKICPIGNCWLHDTYISLMNDKELLKLIYSSPLPKN